MAEFYSLLRKNLLILDRYLKFLLVGWMVLMVALPLLHRFYGERLFLQGLTLLVLVQGLFVLQVLFRSWGWWFLLRLAVGVVLLAWAAEAINLRSGYPFGSYRFSAYLQPQVMGVPFLVPLMWLMMLPPAWAVAKLITRRLGSCLARPVFVLTSAAAFTAWDFYLEPLLSHWGLLVWAIPGAYLGVPWTVFLGRFLVAGLISFAVLPKRLPGGMLVLVYTLTWLAQFLCQLFLWGLPLTALAGFLAMGVMLLCATLLIK